MILSNGLFAQGAGLRDLNSFQVVMETADKNRSVKKVMRVMFLPFLPTNGKL